MDHISVCICTFQRPLLLKRLLEAICRQETRNAFTFSIIVADNDPNESARAVVKEFVADASIRTTYCTEPTPNFALARNKALRNASGDYLALIDDDEVPTTEWLFQMWDACSSFEVAGVLGPVLPQYETVPPAWLKRAGFYDRPRHKTGFKMPWQQSRTGNVVLRRAILDGMHQIFDPAFGEGGEDVDFFRRMNALGHAFIWCDEGSVSETVPPHRWERRFLLHRALVRGQMSFRQPQNRWKNLAKSVIAVPLYTLSLPFLAIVGHHLFMKYLVSLCDHLGRVMALLRLKPVSKRPH